jgi:hypothetical protein
MTWTGSLHVDYFLDVNYQVFKRRNIIPNKKKEGI